MNWVSTFLAAFCEYARIAQVSVIGGDTTRSLGPLFCSATVFGSVSKTHLKKRSGAKAGNLIAVTGSFGYAALGLGMLDRPELAKIPSGFTDARGPVFAKTSGSRPGSKTQRGKKNREYLCNYLISH